MEAGRHELDQSKRKVIYRQLHALLADDQPYTWTLQVSSKWAVNKRLRNVKESKGWGLFQWVPGRARLVDSERPAHPRCRAEAAVVGGDGLVCRATAACTPL